MLEQMIEGEVGVGVLGGLGEGRQTNTAQFPQFPQFPQQGKSMVNLESQEEGVDMQLTNRLYLGGEDREEKN